MHLYAGTAVQGWLKCTEWSGRTGQLGVHIAEIDPQAKGTDGDPEVVIWL